MSYDRPPKPRRSSIEIAADLVRRSDALSIEGAKRLKELNDENAALAAEVERLRKIEDAARSYLAWERAPLGQRAAIEAGLRRRLEFALAPAAKEG